MDPNPERDNYFFERDELAGARLTFQHFALKRVQGWLLHPNIQAFTNTQDHTNPIRVADLATGNGIWALELADELPNAQITCLDVSPDQFPPRYTWPSNVTFDTHDMFKPAPAKYHAHFDIVHVRLVVAAIYNADKDALISNFLSLLKPGGYLQWEEVKYPVANTVDSDMKISDEITSPWRRAFKYSDFSASCKWVVEMPDALKRHGMTDVVCFEPVLRRGTLAHQSESLLWTVQELLRGSVRVGYAEAAEELELATEEARADFKRGVMWYYPWVVTVGRKAV